ncbi:MAG: hypothetical protein AAGE52_08425 [Myxococcota bacterium]
MIEGSLCLPRKGKVQNSRLYLDTATEAHNVVLPHYRKLACYLGNWDLTDCFRFRAGPNAQELVEAGRLTLMHFELALALRA